MEQEGGNILAKYNWVEITREDVIKAIEKFLANNPEYPEPRSTFLVYDGKRLPQNILEEWLIENTLV